MKRCGNCGKYPFCKNIVDTRSCCDKWIYRENKKVIKYEGLENEKKD